jgi:hypothetical protein
MAHGKDDFFSRAEQFLNKVDHLIKCSEPIFLRLTLFALSLYGLAKLILGEVHLP